MPETGDHHVLDRSLFAVCELHLGFLARRKELLRLFADRFGFSRQSRLFGRGLDGFAVPLWIAEVMVGLHKVVDGEVVLTLVQSRTSPDDLLELDHGVDWSHQHNVSHIAGIDPSRKLLGAREYRWDRLFVVLKRSQVLLAKLTVIGSNPNAVVRVLAGLVLIDKVADNQSVELRSAKDNRLFMLVDLLHEQPNTMSFTFLDLDDLVKVRFFVSLTSFNFSLDKRVVWCEDILIERGRDLLDLKWGKKAVVDPVLERVGENWIAKISVGVNVVFAFGSGG